MQRKQAYRPQHHTPDPWRKLFQFNSFETHRVLTRIENAFEALSLCFYYLLMNKKV